MSSRFVITKADESNPSLHGSVNGDEGSHTGDGSATGTPSRSQNAPTPSSPQGSPNSTPAVLPTAPASPPPTVTFSGVVEDERASIKNSGDVGVATNHRDYGSNVNSALLGSPVSEATNDTLDGLHLNNGYQDTIDSSMLEDDKRNLYLYAEEIGHRPHITSVIRQMANYQTAIPGEQEIAASKKTPEVAKLGTILGVYLPCIQNIFGVILFIRLIWVVGTAGSVQGFVIVGMSCCTTMLTAISLSAISTNGVVPGGGSYFMISRNLGPEFGGAVGILFYLATTFAAAMYILGAVEIFLMFMTEGAASLFGPVEKEEDKPNLLNNMRVMGSMLLCFSGTCVFIGVRFVSRLAPIALVCVLFSILSIYIGIFVNTARGGAGLMICILRGVEGDRAIPAGKFENVTAGFGPDSWCDANNTILRDALCVGQDDEFCQEELGKLKYIDGIPGLNSPLFANNWNSLYRKVGNVLQGQDGNENIEVVSDITTTFALLLGLFFPSSTGIMAGSNRSGDLKDPSRSIPVGTIAAILTTSFVYVTSVFFYAGSVEGVLARDKFGLSVRKKLIIANLAWPNEWVILIGSLLSTVGAGLQSLVGAPRLLQAIAKDGIIPILNPLGASDKRGEPVRAILVTIAICEFAILVADLDNFVAQLVTMFFLMCYAFVNLACAVQTLLRTPNWRPRFRFYHWVLSLMGLLLCFTIMFVSNWTFALMAIALASIIYKYIEYRGAEKEWGDGIRGLALSAARYSLLRLEQGQPHTKNWRPQLLALCKLNNELKPKHTNLISFANQLKAGKGLIVIATTLEGKYVERYAEAQAAKQEILKSMEEEKVKGFAEVLVAQDVSEGIGALIQTSGLGGLTHNTVIMGWPYGWRQSAEERSWRVFVEGVRSSTTGHHALLVLKGLTYPSSKERLRGYIDVWWIVHDGGMLMLLPFLLRQHKTWAKCKMRIFTVAQMEDNSVQIKKDLETFLYHLRIEAEVEVVEMPDAAISAYTYERTLLMEQRNQILKDLKLSNKDLQVQPQCILDHSHPVFSSPSKVRVLLHTVKEEESPSQSGTASAGSASPSKKNRSNLDDPASEGQTGDEASHSPVEEGKEASASTSAQDEGDNGESVEVDNREDEDMNQFTFTPGHHPKNSGKAANGLNRSPFKEGGDNLHERLKAITPNTTNIRRMHDAVRLNEVVVAKSHEAQLVILNMPGPPKNKAGEENYMEFLEVLVEGLERVLLVRGGGREVITIYS